MITCAPATARTIAALALVLVALAIPAPAAFGQWYTSDRFGVVRDPIPAEQRSEHEYTVSIERAPSLEVQTLHRDGAPIGRTELEYASDVLIQLRRYDAGTLAATEHYRYWANGSLRSVRRVSVNGATVEYRYRDGRLTDEWVVTPAGRERIRYDDVGRVADRTRWEADEVVEQERREYWGPTAADALRRIVITADGTETVTRYDEAGRALGSQVSRGGEVESDRERVFRDGLLVEERETVDGVVRVWRYEYVSTAADADTTAADGTATDDTTPPEPPLARIRYFENDELVKLTDYTIPDYSRLETLYRGGEAVLRVYYESERRVLEEVIRDGEVIRTRDFRPPEPDATAAGSGTSEHDDARRRAGSRAPTGGRAPSDARGVVA